MGGGGAEKRVIFFSCLIYLRWQLLRGALDLGGHEEWLQLTQDFLAEGRHKGLIV